MDALASIGRGTATVNVMCSGVVSLIMVICGIAFIVTNPQRTEPAPNQHPSYAGRWFGICCLVLAVCVIPITLLQYHFAQTSKGYAATSGALTLASLASDVADSR